MGNIYMSINSIGVDTKAFYYDAGFSISEVSQGTGISRAALSRVPVHKVARETALTALQFMEKRRGQKYCERVKALTEEIVSLHNQIEEEWIQYQKNDGVIDTCRSEYGFERKYQKLVKIEDIPLLSNVKKET